MSIKVKVTLLFLPLVALLAVLAVVGSVNTGRLVERITEVTEVDIPLGNVISRLTESQLEQVIWVEQALYAADRGDIGGVQEALTAFERLSATIDEEIRRGIDIASAAGNEAQNEGSRGAFSEAERILSEVGERRRGYEQYVRDFLGDGTETTESFSLDAVVDLRNEERALYGELEDLRAELSRFTENAAEEVLRSERILMVLLILSAAVVLVIGMLVFPLVLLFWGRDDNS
jgi:hypothetical protein